MERLYFEIRIEASTEVVYNTLIDSGGFREWTSVFTPTSYFQGTWEKDSKMYFLSIDENGVDSGMLSTIKENIPNEQIIIEHYGFYVNEIEITEGEDMEALKGSIESYTFLSEGDNTLLKVETDVYPELKGFFEETWPKALEKLKELCED